MLRKLVLTKSFGRSEYRGCHALDSLEEAPLALASAGGAVEVTRVLGDENLRSRVLALGIIPGAVVTVISGGGRRPMVIALSGSRLLLDVESARSVVVRGREARAHQEASCRETLRLEGGLN